MIVHMEEQLRAWYETGEDVIISAHVPSLMVSVITLIDDDSEEVIH